MANEALNRAVAPSFLSGRRFTLVLASIVAGIAFYLVFTVWGGASDVAAALGRVGWFGVAAVLALSLVNYALRFWRWQLYLRALGHHVETIESARIYVAGWALTASPGKAGEALRGFLLLRWGVPLRCSLAAFVSERLSDLTAIVLLALFGVSAHSDLQAVVFVGMACVVIALAILAQPRLLSKMQEVSSRWSGRIGTLANKTADMLVQARECHRPSLLLAATTLSLIGWLAEAFALHLVLVWMGASPSLAFSVFAYAAAMLAGALSFLPGGLGGAEVVLVGLLLLGGLSSGDAVAATVLIRLATLWFAVLLGLAALVDWMRRDRKRSEGAI
jgi:uncharacterized protein (TIRG00374 family)